MIRAVLFDLDGTLYDRDALVDELVANQYATFERELLDISRAQFIARVLEMDEHGYGEKEAGYRRIVAEWQLAPDLADRLCRHFWSFYDANCRLPLDTATTLRTLRAHGRRLGVVTNGSTERQRAKLVRLGLQDAFDVVLISESEGIRKPSAEIFHRAVERCGVSAEEAAFVGDHPQTDVEGARAAGLLPIWRHVPYWQHVGDAIATVHRLTDILPICLGPRAGM